MARINLTLVFIFVALTGFAQYEQMAGVFVPPQEEPEVHLHLRIGRTQSLVDKADVTFNSLRLGVSYNKKYRFGLLISTLADSVIIQEDLPSDATFNEINFLALGGFFDFMIINNYRWELSVPIQLGYGFTRYKYLDEQKDLIREEDGPYYFLSEIGIGLQYNVNNWLGLGGGVGVRSVSAGDETLAEYSRGPYYNLGLRFNIGGFYQSIFKKEEVKEMKKRYFEAREKYKKRKKKK